MTSVTSNGSTLTKCPSKSAALLPSEIFKDPPIVTYKGYTSSSKISWAFTRGPHSYHSRTTCDSTISLYYRLVCQKTDLVWTAFPENISGPRVVEIDSWTLKYEATYRTYPCRLPVSGDKNYTGPIHVRRTLRGWIKSLSSSTLTPFHSNSFLNFSLGLADVFWRRCLAAKST